MDVHIPQLWGILKQCHTIDNEFSSEMPDFKLK